MAWLICLLVAVLLFAAYTISAKMRWERHTASLDAEKAVAMDSSMPKATPQACPGEPYNDCDPRLLFSPSELDRMAVESQIVHELSLATPVLEAKNSDSHWIHEDSKISSEPEEEAIYVNAKQYHRILKRRAARQQLMESLRINLWQAQTLKTSKDAKARRGVGGVRERDLGLGVGVGGLSRSCD